MYLAVTDVFQLYSYYNYCDRYTYVRTYLVNDQSKSKVLGHGDQTNIKRYFDLCMTYKFSKVTSPGHCGSMLLPLIEVKAVGQRLLVVCYLHV